ncbi:hypothetical protein K469DRAFT_142188 [Zopfia rhizophila CBS 207.26]|uniref:Uncharacterized protein n=1 Tax=Zopfia rhizophila CBS 207.26 TaxID=1314779 RepID=A0A6A6E8Y3_9PEZI|nr:hypothetical protein K469DRAFT_142188 [Zopfia rhizophila CBS 207.26]
MKAGTNLFVRYLPTELSEWRTPSKFDEAMFVTQENVHVLKHIEPSLYGSLKQSLDRAFIFRHGFGHDSEPNRNNGENWKYVNEKFVYHACTSKIDHQYNRQRSVHPSTPRFSTSFYPRVKEATSDWVQGATGNVYMGLYEDDQPWIFCDMDRGGNFKFPDTPKLIRENGTMRHSVGIDSLEIVIRKWIRPSGLH